MSEPTSASAACLERTRREPRLDAPHEMSKRTSPGVSNEPDRSTSHSSSLRTDEVDALYTPYRELRHLGEEHTSFVG